MRMPDRYPFQTLPDHLRRGLDVVFVGINPGTYSVARGHYFARTTSRFWPGFSASKISRQMRNALGMERLGPEHDSLMTKFGFGFTDVVKKPSGNAAELDLADFAEWGPVLLKKLKAYKPRVACFHGLTAYRPFLKLVLNSDIKPILGAQAQVIGSTRIFVVPNPSPANAHFTVKDQAEWYDRLAEFVLDTGGGKSILP
jgi:double-stranded uracil-DNA glycosylase